MLNLFVVHVTALTNRCLYDNAQILTAEEENKLADAVEKIELKANISICLVTVRTMTTDPQKYAEDFYHAYDFKNDGLIILICDNQITMVSFGSVQTPLYENKIKQIVDIGMTELLKDDYYAAFDKMLNATSVYVSKFETNDNKQIPEDTVDVSWIMPTSASLFMSIMATILTACILLWNHNSTNKPVKANLYLSSEQGKSFTVKDRTVIFIGTEHEVIRNYYRSSSSSSRNR